MQLKNSKLVVSLQLLYLVDMVVSNRQMLHFSETGSTRLKSCQARGFYGSHMVAHEGQ